MQLLRKISSFGSNPQEMVQLWKTICLSVFEVSCVVLGGIITDENKKDLEHTQKPSQNWFSHKILQHTETPWPV